MISVSAEFTAANANKKRTPIHRVKFASIATEFATHPIKANYSDEVLADGPSAYWRFGESSGSSAADSSGNSQTGTYQGSPTLGATGALLKDPNTAVTLNGSSQYITVPDNALLDPGDVFSLEAWIYPLAFGGMIFSKGTNGYQLIASASPAGIIAFLKQGSGFDLATSSVAMTLNAWNHVVATKNGSDIHIYLNGVDVTTAGTNATVAGTATDLYIGKFSGVPNTYFHATFDEVAIYPRALSAARTQAHYDTGRALFPRRGVSVALDTKSLKTTAAQVIPERGQSSLSSLVFNLIDFADYDSEVLAESPSLYLRLDELKGTSAVDGSGNGLNGTYQNSPQLGQRGPITSAYPDWAVALNGIDGYVTVADNALLDPGDTLSGEAWVYRQTSTDYYVIFDKGTNGYFFYITSSGTLKLAKSGVADIVASTATIPVATWTHVAFTKTGSTVKLYIDGANVTGSVSNQTIAGTASALRIGQDYAGIFFNGSIARPALYASVLSPARIRAHRNAATRRNGDGTVGAITRLIADGLEKQQVTFSRGFDEILEQSYLQIPFGIVDGYKLTNDLTAYEITVREPATIANQQIFKTAASSLLAGINNSDATAAIRDSSDYLSSGYAILDSEIVSYSGKTPGVAINENSWQAVAYGAGRFVAVSSSGSGMRVATSDDDGLTWVERIAAEDNTWFDIAWNGSLFVAVADSGTHRVMTSPDGEIWTARTAPSHSWFGVCWSSDLSLWVAVGANAVMTSADGITWTDRTASDTGDWVSVVWAGGAIQLFVAVAQNGTNRVMTSPDGINWTNRTAANAVAWQDVAWNGSILVAVSQSGVAATAFMSSTNGTAWTARAATADELWDQVVWSSTDSLFVTISQGSTVNKSSNGTSWSAAGNSAASHGWFGLAENAGKYVAVGTDSVSEGRRAQRSTDAAATWTLARSTLTGLTRGVLSTTAASHSAGVSVQEMLRLTGHPVDIVVGVLENTDKTGCSVPSALVDATGLATLKTQIGSSYTMEYRITGPSNAKTWLEAHWQKVGCYPVTASGKYSAHQMTVPSVAVDSVTHDNLLMNGKVPAIGWDRNLKPSLYNSVTVFFDYGLDGAPVQSKRFTDDTSIAAYGESPLVINGDGFRSELAGTLTLIAAVADVILTRYANGAPLIPMRTFFSKELTEPGDVLSVTSSFLPNATNKTRGVTNLLTEVLSRGIQYGDQGFYVEMTTQAPGWNP